MIKVLFVCMGNICRSPSAEGVFRHLVNSSNLGDKIFIDSAGTHAYHVGNAPDPRSQEAALRRNIDLSSQRAQKVTSDDFIEFDYVIAMDRSNVDDLMSICPSGYEERVHLFLEYAKANATDVPDPYYGQGDGFEIVLDLIEDAAVGLLQHIKETDA